MKEELKTNDDWELLSNPMNIIGTKRVYKNKLDKNGIVTRNKKLYDQLKAFLVKNKIIPHIPHRP